MQRSISGFILLLNGKVKGVYRERDLSNIDGRMIMPGSEKDITHYLICNPHPRREMIKQQADTGQPVWVKLIGTIPAGALVVGDTIDCIFATNSSEVIAVFKTNSPDWNIPNAEYSFTSFEEAE